MTNSLRIEDFDYELDESLIAQHPPKERDGARMLMMNRHTGELSHRQFTHFVDLLHEDDLVVFNETKVIPARLFGHRVGREESIETLLLQRLDEGKWEALVKPGKKMKVGTRVEYGEGLLSAEVLDIKEDGNRIIQFKYDGIWEEILDQLGEMPLPPYIHEKLEDQNRYQTVYAKYDGSAAAPTAGLHFTPETMKQLAEKGIQTATLTLHVGLGTFRPVKADNLDDHIMHSEWYHLPEETVRKIQTTKRRGGRVIAVGTTSLRVLETVGEKVVTDTPSDFSGWTDLFVKPGFRFHVVDSLLTNFHLPKSTLLLLVSAFSSRDAILHAYEVAVKEQYRFFSFGDCMFIYEENR